MMSDFSLQPAGKPEDILARADSACRLPLAINLSGRAGVGKTTAAQVRLGRFGMLGVVARRFQLSTSIKQIAAQMGWDGNKDSRGRQLLIDIGDAGRRFDPHTWVRLLFEVQIPTSECRSLEVVLVDDCVSRKKPVLRRPAGARCCESGCALPGGRS